MSTEFDKQKHKPTTNFNSLLTPDGHVTV